MLCWGFNGEGEIGDGTSGPTAHKSKPTSVLGLSSVAQIAVGSYHTCALLADATVRCWGNNSWGQLGDETSGPTAHKSTPAVVKGLSGVAKVALGGNHTCALLKKDGSVLCWGYNAYGQLGNEERGYRPTPALVKF